MGNVIIIITKLYIRLISHPSSAPIEAKSPGKFISSWLRSASLMLMKQVQVRMKHAVKSVGSSQWQKIRLQ